MSDFLKKWFEWISKHFALLSVIVGAIATLLLTFVWPLFLIKVLIPIWLIILLILLPFSIIQVFNFYSTPTKFNGGERVQVKGFHTEYFVVNYEFFSRKLVRCADHKGVTTVFHQDSLTLIETNE
ncbi:MAG TPA: hypothetical protein VL022_04775 [Moheibacter sp.]|nr:hypothetical protein [Moheibacter sp.]